MTELLLKSTVFGLGGILVGATHALSHYISDPAPGEIQLGAPYTYLQTDPVLLQTLQALDTEFRALHPAAYVRAIQAIDAMVGLRITLSDTRYAPILQDRVKGVVYFRRARTSLQRFLCHAEQHRMPRRVIYLQRDLQTLMGRLDVHLQTIVMLTRDIHIHPSRPMGSRRPGRPIPQTA